MTDGELDMSQETVRNILVQNLGMRKLAAKLVPRNLTEEQKVRRLTLCMEFGELLQEDNFLDRVITGDETWCYQYDAEAIARPYKSPRPKEPRISKSKTKKMLICFFDIGRTIHFEFVPEGTTVSETLLCGGAVKI
jgi:histone-lysine N-methyltransferase SETMAR